MIVLEELAKHYGRVRAVGGISLSVEAGEMFGFLGPNGSGKTTTVKMLCTLVRPTSGRGRLNGAAPIPWSPGPRDRFILDRHGSRGPPRERRAPPRLPRSEPTAAGDM